MCKLELTVGDIDLLVAKHSHGDALGRVNYKSFAEAIDSGTRPTGGRTGAEGRTNSVSSSPAAFTQVGLETAPSTAIASVFRPSVPSSQLTQAEEAAAAKSLAAIAEYILTRKVLVRPAFEDHEANQVCRTRPLNMIIVFARGSKRSVPAMQNSVMIVQHVTFAQFAQVGVCVRARTQSHLRLVAGLCGGRDVTGCTVVSVES